MLFAAANQAGLVVSHFFMQQESVCMAASSGLSLSVDSVEVSVRASGIVLPWKRLCFLGFLRLSHCLASSVSRVLSHVLQATLQPFPCGPLSAWDSSQLGSWLGRIDWEARAGERLSKVEARVLCNLILEVTSHYFYCLPLKEARDWVQPTLKERKLYKGVGLVRCLQRQRANRMYYI